MQESPQEKSLALVPDYPRSDMEYGEILNPKLLHRKEKSNKCLVYILAAMVIVGTILLVFASIFLHARTPGFEIRSATVRNLKYATNSSAPSFNFTLVTQVAVENTNFFGDFRFENSNGSVWCGSEIVGQMKIPKGIAQARATERMNIFVDLSSLRLSGTTNLSSNISSGLLKLNSYVKLSGKVSIMNFLRRRRNPEMNCFMKLNLTGNTIQGLNCD